MQTKISCSKLLIWLLVTLESPLAVYASSYPLESNHVIFICILYSIACLQHHNPIVWVTASFRFLSIKGAESVSAWKKRRGCHFVIIFCFATYLLCSRWGITTNSLYKLSYKDKYFWLDHNFLCSLWTSWTFIYFY